MDDGTLLTDITRVREAMTAIKPIDLTCPNCQYTFTSAAATADAADARGRKRTDFQIKTDGVAPLQYGVHLCERCGYAGREDLFSGRDSVSFEVRQHVWDELAPRLSEIAVLPSEKYEFAARVATWDGMSPGDIADLWLRAAWCCVDEGDIEAERFYRRHAVWKFEEALDSFDGVARGDRPVLTYLVGELWRRIGDVVLANEWFARVPDEVFDPQKQGWLLRWSRQQRECPREWFV